MFIQDLMQQCDLVGEKNQEEKKQKNLALPIRFTASALVLYANKCLSGLM